MLEEPEVVPRPVEKAVDGHRMGHRRIGSPPRPPSSPECHKVRTKDRLPIRQPVIGSGRVRGGEASTRRACGGRPARRRATGEPDTAMLDAAGRVRPAAGVLLPADRDPLHSTAPDPPTAMPSSEGVQWGHWPCWPGPRPKAHRLPTRSTRERRRALANRVRSRRAISLLPDGRADRLAATGGGTERRLELRHAPIHRA